MKILKSIGKAFSLTVFIFVVCSFAYMNAVRTVSAEDIKLPPAPQLVTDVWLFIIGYEADPAAIKAILPPGLEPNPSNLVIMNMYTVPDPSLTSGFGAYTLTYLAVQLKDQDSYIMGSATGEPGRYFAFYFNSSELMREFTKKVGINAETGMTTQTIENGKLKSVLEVGGKPFIIATADVGAELQPAVGGHLNYFGLRESEMNGKKMTQLMKYPFPFVSKPVKTENGKVQFTGNIPKAHPINRLKPKKVVWASYMKGGFVYPQAEILKEWESTAKK